MTRGCTLHVPGYGVATYPVKVVDGRSWYLRVPSIGIRLSLALD